MPNPVSSCILSSALALGASASAQAVPASVPLEAAAVSAPVGEADAKVLHKMVEGWLAIGQVPPTSVSQVWADKAVGVVVTLRLEGVTMGQGQAVRVDLAQVLGGQEGKPLDLVPLLRQAATEAFAKAEARLRETSGPVDGSLLAVMGHTLCVDVQVGHKPAPVLQGGAGTEGGLEASAQVYSGWHGLALCAAAAREGGPSLSWPGTQMAEGLAQDTVLRRLLVAQQVPEADVKKMCRPGGPQLHTFEVFQVVRPRPNLPAMALVRGAALVPESAITTPTLRALADRTATHLLTKVMESGALRGGYRPAENTWQPAEASPSEAGLAAYALARVASLRLGENPQDELGVQCVKAVSALARKLEPQVSDAAAAPQPLAAAFLLLSLTDAPGGVDRDWRDRLAVDLMALDTGKSGYAVKVASGTPGGAEVSKPVGRTTAAIITCALASWYERTRNAKAEGVVRRQLDGAFGASEGFETPEAAYWLALAERRAGLPLAATDKEPEKAKAAHADRLRRLAEALGEMRAEQIRRAPETGPADVVGGFVFGKQNLPLPTWRSAFVMALWGGLLREEAAIPAAERAAHLRGVGQGARFMAQLIETPASAYACRNPGALVGGVRGAPWDTRLDTQPAAMTLLALVEVVEGLEKK